MLKTSYKERKCKSCNKTLSVYNNEKICAKCAVNPADVLKALKEIKDIADGKNKLS
jgi:Zn finger protein HypA/HybF involved in hydrogenase expression